MDEIDREIVNRLQGGFPLVERPFLAVAEALAITEDDLIARIQALVDGGELSRFGPLYNAERMGGAVTLAAVSAPAERIDAVVTQINSFPEVAHHYEREHRLNLWFVVSTEDPARLPKVLAEIAETTGCRVYDMPKLDEYYLNLKFSL